MKKIFTALALLLLLGVALTLGACGWGTWHGHGRGMHGAAPVHMASGVYWHGSQYGYNHYNGCGHIR